MKELNEVVELLSQKIPADAIHAADQQRGIFGDYITAQYAMQRANQIFDVDGIADMELVSATHIELPKLDLPYGDWMFERVVKIWVRIKDGQGGILLTPRLGQGFGVAQAPYNSKLNTFEPVKPQQLDTAIKSALSDAIKNALMRFGESLGAGLYFDERGAQALGFETYSAQAAKRTEQEEAELPDVKVPDEGWGRDKKYGGMTLAEMYVDAEGFGALEWASRQEKPYGLVAKMAEYFKLMQAEGEELAEEIKSETTQAKAEKKVVMMWFGKEKPADEITSGTGAWRALVANQPFVDMLTAKFNPDDKIPNFHASHPRVYNHFKRHFHIDKGEELTWGMLQALYTFCTEGSDAAAFGWPEYYAGDRAPTEATLEAEKQTPVPNTPDADIEDMIEKDFPSNNIVIGPRGQQKIPVSVQKMIKDAGVDKPDDWLWDTIGGEPVGEWTAEHTALLGKLIEAASKSGQLDDTEFTALLWEVSVVQL